MKVVGMAAAAAGGGWAVVCEKFRTARTLSSVESRKDPETEPYRSKYSARALLQEVKQLLSAAEEGGEPRLLAVRRAVLEYELGVNHTDTEELSAGEEHLQRCTQLLEPHRLSPDCVSLYIQAQNNLGILWSERDEIKTAQTYLESAEALYNQYMKEQPSNSDFIQFRDLMCISMWYNIRKPQEGYPTQESISCSM